MTTVLSEQTKRVKVFALRTKRRLINSAIERYLRLHPDPSALDATAAIERMREAETVTVLCHGNICRSPFAERMLSSRSELDHMTVHSSGFYPKEGRRSPNAAQEAAAEFGVDLDDHRSEPVTTTELEQSDIVFVMDVNNYRRLREEFPEALHKTYFFGIFGESDGYLIPDPYGTSVENFRRIYRSLSDEIDALVESVAAD